MTDICEEEISDFLLTFAEAMAVHAFGKKFSHGESQTISAYGICCTDFKPR